MSKKVRQLTEVIALQEKTITKLQKMIDTKKSTSKSKTVYDTKKSSEAKQDQRYLPPTYTKMKLEFNENNPSNRMRNKPSISQNQISQVSTDYINDINSLRGRMEGVNLNQNQIKQELAYFNDNKENQINQLESQLKDKNSKISILQEQIRHERDQRVKAETELTRQRQVWTRMFQEIQNDMEVLKGSLRAYSSPNIQQKQKKSSRLYFQNV